MACKCPQCGSEPLGTEDWIPATALTDDDGEHVGETEVYWDGQQTHTDPHTHAMVYFCQACGAMHADGQVVAVDLQPIVRPTEAPWRVGHVVDAVLTSMFASGITIHDTELLDVWIGALARKHKLTDGDVEAVRRGVDKAWNLGTGR